MINRDRIRLVEQTIRVAVNDQLIVADQDIGIAAWRETIGLFARASDLLRRSNARAVTISDYHRMAADGRLDTPEQQVIRPAASRTRHNQSADYQTDLFAPHSSILLTVRSHRGTSAPAPSAELCRRT